MSTGDHRKYRVVVGRRDLLTGALGIMLVPLGSVAAAATTAACSSDDEKASPFKHGIASGDPLSDSMILWTRVTVANSTAAVDWEVAEDPEMQKRVSSGTFHTDASRDFTVKVDVNALKPGTTYYYRFTAEGISSKVGRMRTAPRGPNEHIRFALVACASFAHGYFHGYRVLAKELDLDAVIHLGDYIYEYGSNEYGDVRPYEPEHEIKTLDDYRTRHSLYKREADLQAIHQQHTFITIWDDHEIANDGYKDGAENHTEGAEGSWVDRKAAALRAYKEWMPIRETPDGRIFRTIGYGDLVDLILLDTRYWARTIQSGGVIGPPPPPDPTRTLLGDEQAKWLEDQLKGSKATWKLIGQQVMVGSLLLESGAKLANLDQWHGYPESRTRLLNFFRDSGVKNIVVLTGDIHSSWANELVIDPNDKVAYDATTGRGSLGVEFVTPGISSPGIPSVFLGLVDTARPFNSHIRWLDPSRRGYCILDVTRERVQGAWYLFEDIVLPDPVSPAFAQAWKVTAGETHLTNDPSAAPGRDNVPAAAPT